MSTPVAVVPAPPVAVAVIGEIAGPAGRISGVTVQMLDPGAEASVVLGGTPSNRSMEFRLPRGQQGLPGVDGLDGVASATAPLAYDAPTRTVALEPGTAAGQVAVWNGATWAYATLPQGANGRLQAAGANGAFVDSGVSAAAGVLTASTVEARRLGTVAWGASGSFLFADAGGANVFGLRVEGYNESGNRIVRLRAENATEFQIPTSGFKLTGSDPLEPAGGIRGAYHNDLPIIVNQHTNGNGIPTAVRFGYGSHSSTNALASIMEPSFTGGRMMVGAGNPAGWLHAKSALPGVATIVAQAAASNSSNFFEAQSSTGVSITTITGGGLLRFPDNTLPNGGLGGGIEWWRAGSYGSRLIGDPPNGNLVYQDITSGVPVARFTIARSTGNVTTTGLITAGTGIYIGTLAAAAGVVGERFSGGTGADSILFRTFRHDGASHATRMALTEGKASDGTRALLRFLDGTRLQFDAADTAPASTAAPATWLRLDIGGTQYRLPLYL